MKKLTYHIDIDLLIFLLLFTNVKLYIKVIALIFIYSRRFNFRIGPTFKHPRLPPFYFLIIIIAAVNWLSGGIIIDGYNPVFVTGLIFWLACILAVHQIKLAVEKNADEKLVATIIAFFIINIAASFIQLVIIIIETGSFNPYRYQGLFQKYFISTGDHIKGISFDTSTTNAVISSLGIIYFLVKERPIMLFLCMATLLLTASNLTNVIMLVVFICMLFRSSRNRKSLILICSMMLVLFIIRISPQNNNYVSETVKAFNPARTGLPANFANWKSQVTSVKPAEEKIKEEVAEKHIEGIRQYFIDQPKLSTFAASMLEHPELPRDDIHSPGFQSRKDTTAYQLKLISFIKNHSSDIVMAHDPSASSKPGKIIAFQQTLNYFKDHPVRMLTGTGMGMFSSKLAFRATALNISGGYPASLSFINKDFLRNHLDIYLYFFTRNAGEHSITNSPGSVYDQLWAEYGLTGLAVFIIFYFGYFFRKRKYLTYGIPLLFTMMALFFADYWFEQLSVIPLFELFLFMDLKNNGRGQALPAGRQAPPLQNA